MPLSLQPDRKMFGVTLALCLIGAVMVFSASASPRARNMATATRFCCARCCGSRLGLPGMFALMNMDYRKLRQPRVIFTALSVTLVLLICRVFSRPLARHASLDSRWAR